MMRGKMDQTESKATIKSFLKNDTIINQDYLLDYFKEIEIFWEMK